MKNEKRYQLNVKIYEETQESDNRRTCNTSYKTLRFKTLEEVEEYKKQHQDYISKDYSFITKYSFKLKELINSQKQLEIRRI